MDVMTPEQEIDRVIKIAEVNHWNIYKGENKYNFHIITENALRLQRIQYVDFKGKVVKMWSYIDQFDNRYLGTYLDIMTKFCKDYSDLQRCKIPILLSDES